MSGTFGTLRKDSYFTPAEVLDEATSLDAAIRLLARAAFNDDANTDPDLLAAWNSYVETWRAFWAECNAWDGWVFRAENNTRDNLIDFEARYQELKAQFSDAGANTDALPQPAAEGNRTADNLSTALNGAGKAFEKISWQLAAGAAVVVVGLVGVLYVARRGGLPV